MGFSHCHHYSYYYFYYYYKVETTKSIFQFRIAADLVLKGFLK